MSSGNKGNGSFESNVSHSWRDSEVSTYRQIREAPSGNDAADHDDGTVSTLSEMLEKSSIPRNSAVGRTGWRPDEEKDIGSTLPPLESINTPPDPPEPHTGGIVGSARLTAVSLTVPPQKSPNPVVSDLVSQSREEVEVQHFEYQHLQPERLAGTGDSKSSLKQPNFLSSQTQTPLLQLPQPVKDIQSGGSQVEDPQAMPPKRQTTGKCGRDCKICYPHKPTSKPNPAPEDSKKGANGEDDSRSKKEKRNASEAAKFALVENAKVQAPMIVSSVCDSLYTYYNTGSTDFSEVKEQLRESGKNLLWYGAKTYLVSEQSPAVLRNITKAADACASGLWANLPKPLQLLSSYADMSLIATVLSQCKQWYSNNMTATEACTAIFDAVGRHVFKSQGGRLGMALGQSVGYMAGGLLGFALGPVGFIVGAYGGAALGGGIGHFLGKTVGETLFDLLKKILKQIIEYIKSLLKLLY